MMFDPKGLRKAVLRARQVVLKMAQASSQAKAVSVLGALVLATLPFQNCASGYKANNVGQQILDSNSLALLPSTCQFDGKTLQDGETATAWLSSTTTNGATCTSEVRTCQKGLLSGSFNYSSCSSSGGPAACLYNGQTLASGLTVTAYLNSTASAGQNCESEVRTCTDGVLSGSFNYASCQPSGPQACLFNGVTVPSGQSVPAFLNSSAKACVAQSRTCTNGNLSGTYTSSSCVAASTAACSFNGATLPSGSTVVAFQNSSVPAGSSCVQENRSCNQGQLSGSFNFSSCNVAAPAACLFNGQTVASGESVKAYPTSTVAYGQTCTFETRVCTNGSLSGSAGFAACSTLGPASCQFNGQSIASGQNVTAYAVGQVAYGQSCTPQMEVRTCTNGSLSGTATFASCTPGQPSPCKLGLQTIAHQQTVQAFTAASVPFGQLCSTVAETLTCNNGTLTGGAAGTTAYPTCAPATGASCTAANGQTIASGQALQTFTQSTVPYGQSCSTVEQDATCTNGTLTGAGAYTKCQALPAPGVIPNVVDTPMTFAGDATFNGPMDEILSAYQSWQTSSSASGKTAMRCGSDVVQVLDPALNNPDVFNGQTVELMAYGAGMQATGDCRVLNSLQIQKYAFITAPVTVAGNLFVVGSLVIGSGGSITIMGGQVSWGNDVNHPGVILIQPGGKLILGDPAFSSGFLMETTDAHDFGFIVNQGTFTGNIGTIGLTYPTHRLFSIHGAAGH